MIIRWSLLCLTAATLLTGCLDEDKKLEKLKPYMDYYENMG